MSLEGKGGWNLWLGGEKRKDCLLSAIYTQQLYRETLCLQQRQLDGCLPADKVFCVMIALATFKCVFMYGFC